MNTGEYRNDYFDHSTQRHVGMVRLQFVPLHLIALDRQLGLKVWGISWFGMYHGLIDAKHTMQE